MKREVLVSISGSQQESGEDALEVLLPGQYYKRKDTHYIKYDQYDEDTGELLKNTIKVKGDSVELKKTGYSNVRMYFKENSHYTSYYDMREGSLLMETHTGKVQVREQEDSMDIMLEYDLYLNEQYISNCQVAIKVVERSGVGE
ncbi:MAG: DUF1934 domain-containing protein [Lachnospiraceae bacterium]|nr:DUF1934 domain-containing protein [Lachnospiraceae bacterium]